MFDEEEQELQHNPDDDSYGTLRTSDVDDEVPATATTPRRSKKSRKRTRSQDSAASITLDSTHQVSTMRNRKALNKRERLEVTKFIRSAPVLQQLNTIFKECSIFRKLGTEEETLATLLQFHQKTFAFLYEGSANGKEKIVVSTAMVQTLQYSFAAERANDSVYFFTANKRNGYSSRNVDGFL